MAIRFYIVPKQTLLSSIVPKYFMVEGLGSVIRAIVGDWVAMDGGREPWMLVRADVTDAEHTALNGHADVIVVPANLDSNVGAALGTVQTRLDQINVPSDWVTATHTYRQVLRFVGRYGCLLQVFGRRALARFFELYTLDSTMAQLSAAHRDRLREAATEIGVSDTSSINGSSTVREVLRLLTDQMVLNVRMSGEVI
jgi:hypothetical protein